MGKFIEIVSKYITDDSDATLQMLDELKVAEDELKDCVTEEDILTAVKAKDDEWRRRYKEAFFKSPEVEITEDETEDGEKLKFEDLFDEVK